MAGGTELLIPFLMLTMETGGTKLFTPFLMHAKEAVGVPICRYQLPGRRGERKLRTIVR